MLTVIFGILVLLLALWVLDRISKFDPKIATRLVKAAGGLVSLAIGVFLGLRGEFAVAIPLAAFGIGLLGWMPFGASAFRKQTPESLVAYLDRRDAGWREHAQADAATGSSSRASSGKMSEDEAHQILGLQPGASIDDVAKAHRRLMKRLHPDQGGTTYLAARINEAKEVLTRRHR